MPPREGRSRPPLRERGASEPVRGTGEARGVAGGCGGGPGRWLEVGWGGPWHPSAQGGAGGGLARGEVTGRGGPPRAARYGAGGRRLLSGGSAFLGVVVGVGGL